MACNVIYNPTDRYAMGKDSYATGNATASAAVFGTPITGYSSKKDLAKAAFDMKDACQNDAQVSRFIENEKQKLINLVNFIIGMAYNATGEAITYVDQHVWKGYKPLPLPPKIDNGQMLVFFHCGAKGSKACAIYAVRGISDTPYDWIFAWDSTAAHAYTKIRDVGTYNWNEIEKQLDASGNLSSDERDGLLATAGINGCHFFATITLFPFITK